MASMPGDVALPLQTPGTLQQKIEQVQQQQALLTQQQALLTQLRATGDLQLIRQADALQQQYHVRDMCALSKDVYRSAAHEPAPPGLGWIRVSEHPELLKERLGVDWSKQQIEDYLQPLHSDFRAEIYLPDPRVYGPEVKPVISGKGSNGAVAVPDGKGGFLLRDSALEDWIENARQGVGLESDHADRAMTLAVDFKRDFKKPFDNVGHSKAAVGASAAAKLTGNAAYIFNGAGLNPKTVERYAEQHQSKIFDVEKSIHSYHVQGEVLHDAQAGIHDMDGRTRAQVGLAARRLGELSHLHDLRALASDQLAQVLPYDRPMQKAALELLDYLGAHSNSEMLKGVPLPAGASQIELPAMMRDAHGQLLARPPQPTLGEIGADAGPLLNVLSGALAGGVAGKRSGDVIAAAGRGVEQGTQWMGARAMQGSEVYGYVMNAGVQGSGRLVAGSIHYGGAAAADLRLTHGYAQASIDRGLGSVAQWSNTVNSALLHAQSQLPFMDGLKQVAARADLATAAYVESQHKQAANDLARALQDASAIRHWADAGATTVQSTATVTGQTLRGGAERVGGLINDGYQVVGSSVRTVTDRVPEAGAALGGALGGVAVGASEFVSDPLPTVLKSSNVLQHGKPAAMEAVGRHAAEEVLLPSLDARTRQMENGGIQRMQALRQPLAQHPQKPITPANNPSAFLQRMLDSAKAGDWAAFRNDTQTLANMPPGRELHASAVATVNEQEQRGLSQQGVAQQVVHQSAPAQATAPGVCR